MLMTIIKNQKGRQQIQTVQREIEFLIKYFKPNFQKRLAEAVELRKMMAQNTKKMNDPNFKVRRELRKFVKKKFRFPFIVKENTEEKKIKDKEDREEKEYQDFLKDFGGDPEDDEDVEEIVKDKNNTPNTEMKKSVKLMKQYTLKN